MHFPYLALRTTMLLDIPTPKKSATESASDTEQVVSTTVRPHRLTMKTNSRKGLQVRALRNRFHNPDLSANTPQAQAHAAAANGAEHIRFLERVAGTDRITLLDPSGRRQDPSPAGNGGGMDRVAQSACGAEGQG